MIDTKTRCRERLTQARTDLKQLLHSLSEEQWQATVISEGQTWTVADVVAHLLENEQGMSIHVHKIRQGKETVPENFSLEAWNAGLKERTRSLEPQTLLASLDQVRARTLKELETLAEEEWSLTGRHPRSGPITIEQYYETIAHHDEWHANDIRQALGL